jgi:SAM-dependent methyltransferase
VTSASRNRYNADLAFIHHDGFGALSRAAAAEVLALLGKSGYTSGTVVDLGCGTGGLAAVVAAAGYHVVGIDPSAEMLTIAAETVPAGQWVRASMLDVDLPEAVAVTAVGESLNYALDDRATGGSQLLQLAGRVKRALRPGGWFVLDVAAPGRVGARPRRACYRRGAWQLEVRAEEDRAQRLMTHRIRAQRKLGTGWRRTDQTHVLPLYEPEEVVGALSDVGFACTVRDGYGPRALGAGWFVVCAHTRARV